MIHHKLLAFCLCVCVLGGAISAAAQHTSKSLKRVETFTSNCLPNPDPLYDRPQVMLGLAKILNESIPEYLKANSKGYYTDAENGIGFFVVDLTNPSNKYVSLGDCVNFINGHVYHVAPLQSAYSLSQIVILEDGRSKVFRSINCPKRGDRLQDVIDYLDSHLANDKQKNQIINRIRHYRKYGYYYSMDHAGFNCKQR